MRRPFPTSIYVGMVRGPAKPSYRKTSLLDLVRGERKLIARQQSIRKLINPDIITKKWEPANAVLLTERHEGRFRIVTT